jgi:hypothetical protein
MIMPSSSTPRGAPARRLLAAALFAGTALAACNDDITRPGATPTPPAHDPVPTGASFTCLASVSDRRVSCTPTDASKLGALGNIIGGQDVYIRLSSSGTQYDNGTEIFSTNVTVQSLVQTLIGTTDSTTVDGMSVFFHSGPTVTSGSGAVSVFNPDGTDAFTGSNQPYFRYNEILEPYQISGARQWQFAVPSTVNTFEFVVYVSTPIVDINAPLLDAVWGGTSSTDWGTADNWQTGSVPDSGSVVAIPRASLLPSGANFPTLSADDTLNAVRVGEASTLDLGAHTMLVTGNVDAPGTITNGIIQLSGATARLGGNLPTLEISGGASLQRATATSGSVSVTGTLSTQDLPLTIAIP